MPKLPDEEYTKKLHRQFYAQQAPKRLVIKLPCKCGISLELQRPADKFLGCPNCGRQFFYKHSPISGRGKLYER